MSFIYVLHFHEKLAHARHYIGCTDNLRGRLFAHATGAGSRLCRELYQRGIEWSLGGLYQCSHRRMRALERGLKDQAHSDRFCEKCNKNQHAYRGCKAYSIDLVPFPTHSDLIRQCATPITGQTVRLTTPDEKPTTIQAILAMMKRDKDALGFVPAGGSQGLEMLVPRGLIAVAELNGEIAGYASHTINPGKTRATIHQCCVRDDARLRHLGTQMVQLVKDSHDVDEVVAKVRVDLAANHFWSNIGFKLMGTVTHPTSKNLINHYHHDLNKE